MNGEERREKIVHIFSTAKEPVSGSTLARLCQVSRQVIVQDIALLRANGYGVVPTPKGYLLENRPGVSRQLRLRHSYAEIEDALNTIVDVGGRVVNVAVIHPVFGHMSRTMDIHSRRSVQALMAEVSGRTLGNEGRAVTYVYTVEAGSETLLNVVEKELNRKWYLVTGG